MWVGICKRLLTVITVAHICDRVVTTSITVSVHVVFSFMYYGNSLGIAAGGAAFTLAEQ